jgi:hypothetical protein
MFLKSGLILKTGNTSDMSLNFCLILLSAYLLNPQKQCCSHHRQNLATEAALSIAKCHPLYGARMQGEPAGGALVPTFSAKSGTRS